MFVKIIAPLFLWLIFRPGPLEFFSFEGEVLSTQIVSLFQCFPNSTHFTNLFTKEVNLAFLQGL